MALELPQAGPGNSGLERADAARNRERILKVAGDLVACRGIDHVSMQEIAREAQVGTGTVYRRFGDRAGLALALLEAETAEFQDALLRGVPPLGPGAPAIDRLRAFGVAYLELLERFAPLIGAATATLAEDRGPATLYITHMTVLLREACPGIDVEHAALMLWSGLDASQFVATRNGLGWSLERLQHGWESLVDLIAAGASAAALSV